MIRIWVDADSCPAGARNIIVRFAERLKLPCFFVANRPIPLPPSPFLYMIISSNEADAADDYIVEHCLQDDITITRDIPLAARLVEKGLSVLNDRGTLYTSENISERLSLRNFNLVLYELGLSGEKTDTYGKKELRLFANCLDRILQKRGKT